MCITSEIVTFQKGREYCQDQCKGGIIYELLGKKGRITLMSCTTILTNEILLLSSLVTDCVLYKHITTYLPFYSIIAIHPIPKGYRRQANDKANRVR